MRIKGFITALIILITIAFTGTITAQAPTQLYFKELTINDGLSQGFISGITQDKLGLMWFATGDGLNKYDGYNFTVYHHDPDDSTSIGSDDLSYVFEDSKQRLWICTRNNGVDYFDRANNVFYHIRSAKNGLRSDKILTISEDSTGALYIATDVGFDRLELIQSNQNKNNRNENFFSLYSLRITHIKPPNPQERGTIYTDTRGRTFYSTYSAVNELVFKPDNSYAFTEKFKMPPAHLDYMLGMLEDKESYSLFVNGEQIIRFPGYDFNLPHTVLKYPDYSVGHVWTIDKNQVIWLMNGAQINRIYIPTGERTVFTPADAAQNAALSTVTGIFCDRQGIIWIATGGYGILKYDPEVERFHHILPNAKYYQILERRPNEIITNNFDKIILNKEHSPEIKEDDLLQLIRSRFLNSNIIYFTKDTSGNLWIPEGSILYYYNLKTGAQKTYQLTFDDYPAPIYPLYLNNNNQFWFGYRKYLVNFNVATNNKTRYNYPLLLPKYEDEFLQSIYEDGNILWLGSTNGLFKFDVAQQRMVNAWYFQPGDTTSLSNNYVYCFCNDIKEPGKYLWIGTKGGGLNRFDKTTGKFIRYNTKKGLANNVVYGILPGDDGNLWLSTNKGLSAFNPETKQFRNFNVSDGLQSNEFNRYAYCKTSNGLLVFGGMNGLNYFDPNEIKPLSPPDIVFTNFRLFNKTVKISEPSSPLKENISYAKEIELQYKQNVITFQFAAVDYRRTGSIRYRYKMEGFDKDWIYAGTAHEATYTNLDPGDYDFIVQASFEDNVWGNQKKSIHIFIITPWFNTWWFYVLMALFTSAIVYGLYRFRLLQLKRLDKLRGRIARDLHDEVGSSISTIAIYSKIMQEQMDSVDFDNKPLVDKINDFAADIMSSMNDIVWNINTKNDAFDRIISRMREQASQLLEAKGYNVHFDIDEVVNRMKLNMDRRREFYLIYKEAINNIAKYAAGENVWITLFVENSFINLAIRDDGKGFDKSKPHSGSSGGNGLGNMQQRAKTLKGVITINSSPGDGTEIKLNFYGG